MEFFLRELFGSDVEDWVGSSGQHEGCAGGAKGVLGFLGMAPQQPRRRDARHWGHIDNAVWMNAVKAYVARIRNLITVLVM